MLSSTTYNVFSLSCVSVNVQRLEQAYVRAPWPLYILYIFIFQCIHVEVKILICIVYQQYQCLGSI